MERDQRFAKGAVTAVAVMTVGVALWAWQSGIVDNFWRPRPSIVDPEEVKDGAYPYVVGVNFNGSVTPRCTGTIIAPKIVLTAAHCLRDVEGAVKQVMIGRKATTDGSSWFQDVVDFRKRMDPYGDNVAGSDLALLELRNPARTASGNLVSPLAFVTDTTVDSATSYRIVGFGATNTAGTAFPKRKLQSRRPVVSRTNDCSGANDSSTFGCFPGREIVAGRQHESDTCKGDSGGPLLVAPDGTGGILNGTNFKLAGVTSRGIRNSPTTCGQGGIYERLDSDARRWISEKSAELLRN